MVFLVALLLYDHLLMFSAEVELVWRRKFTGAKIIFLAVRYCSISSKILNLPRLLQERDDDLLDYFWEDQDSIFRYTVWVELVFGFFAAFAVYAFHILRIYAIWDKEWRAALLVAVVGFGIACTGLVSFTSPPFPFCPTHSSKPLYDIPILLYVCGIRRASTEFHVINTLSEVVRYLLVALPSALAAEILMLVLTIIKTRQMQQIASGVPIRMRLSHLLLRNGSVYFIVLTTTDTLILCSRSLAWSFSPVVYLIDSISTIMVTRFILSLRSMDLPETNVPGEITTSTAGNFWRAGLQLTDQVKSLDVLGNIGSPLDYAEINEPESNGDDTSFDNDPLAPTPTTTILHVA
ncbi:hypothetical protein NLI96_g10212 [Meripilus lineatus]|uniref:DUF6533 domain-containing protein n=1 Tax=Meripilus lineatus TaxID=2056292 RepID=A0AAD5YEF1_9APHY|nr:hypothetical protein NLI96_g10212 [Physisporinus lineatus]